MGIIKHIDQDYYDELRTLCLHMWSELAHTGAHKAGYSDYEEKIAPLQNACAACHVAKMTRNLICEKAQRIVPLCCCCPVKSWQESAMEMRNVGQMPEYACNKPGAEFYRWMQHKRSVDRKAVAAEIANLPWFPFNKYRIKIIDEFGVDIVPPVESHDGDESLYRKYVIGQFADGSLRHAWPVTGVASEPAPLIDPTSVSANLPPEYSIEVIPSEPTEPKFEQLNVSIRIDSIEELAWLVSVLNYAQSTVKKMNEDCSFNPSTIKKPATHGMWSQLHERYMKHMRELDRFKAGRNE